MEELHVERRPKLRRPALVCVFQGWNDGGQGASLAGSFLAREWGAERFAEIDPELFFDFQATRPHISFAEGRSRRIDWPENSFHAAILPDASRDVILLLGTEPHLRWRSFCGIVCDLGRDLGVEFVVTLGSLLADVPHTRPAPVTGNATDPNLMEELGLQASRYEGPTGIVGALHDSCRTADIPSASLWAAVPHYVSMTPSPWAAKALAERLADLLKIPLDTSELNEAGDAYMRQVSEAVASDPDTAAYVDELEQRVDEILNESDLPSGDALAAELTQFLREQDEDDDTPDAARGDH